MYTSRRGFTPQGLWSYGLSGPIAPSVSCRPGGLGDAETESDCAQPVSGQERDDLRNQIKEWTNPYEADHFHEGHPDLKAIYADITHRLSGLEQRPKLLRCSKDARDRANNWMGQLKDLCMRVKSDGPHCSGYTRVPSSFSFTVFRGPTYTVRSSSDPAVQASQAAFAGRAPAGSAAVPPVSSAPPGSVVVGGVVYATSAEATAAEKAAAAAAAATPVSTPAPTVVDTSGAPVSLSVPTSVTGVLQTTVAGIPVMYIALGLVGYLLLKGK